MSKKIKSFIILTFVISWLIWLPGVTNHMGWTCIPIPDPILILVGALSPLISTFYLEYRDYKWVGIKNILLRSFDFRLSVNWYMICVGLPLLLLGLSRLTLSLFESELPESDLIKNPFMVFPLLILFFLIGGGLNEEIGWRNYVLENYQKRHNALKSSIILAFYWILWHLPLFLMSSTNQATIPYWLFVLAVVPLSVLITWIYNSTNGSIFAVALLHSMGNLAHEIFKVFPTSESPSIIGFIALIILYSLTAIFITFKYSYRTLSK